MSYTYDSVHVLNNRMYLMQIGKVLFTTSVEQLSGRNMATHICGLKIT